ncbi:MAG: NADH-quinone oxidoreductase subunit A [Thermoprotei archaeon]
MTDIGILMFVLLGAAISALLEFVPKILTRSDPTTEKLVPFESGEDSIGSSRIRFRIQYYVYAVAFVAFDIVAAIAIPWALGWNLETWTPILVLFASMLLVIGYYAVRGDLEWS